MKNFECIAMKRKKKCLSASSKRRTLKLAGRTLMLWVHNKESLEDNSVLAWINKLILIQVLIEKLSYSL